nr:MAG TPA: hypothetical protein [Caudoviricetes sp.]
MSLFRILEDWDPAIDIHHKHHDRESYNVWYE